MTNFLQKSFGLTSLIKNFKNLNSKSVSSLSISNSGFNFENQNLFLINSLRSNGSYRTYSKKTITEELNLPNPPQKPLNPAFSYAIKERTDNPNSEKFSDLLKHYKNLPEDERNVYRDNYSQQISEYKIQLEKYYKELSTEDRIEIESLHLNRRLERLRKMSERREMSTKQELKKLAESLGKPKHPGNVFIIFLKDFKSKGKFVSMDLASYTKTWKNLPDSEKEVHKQEYRKNYLSYKEELNIWEKKMASEGRYDVLRKTSPYYINEDATQ